MANCGYGRVSTQDQHLEAQLQQLQEAGCDRIYQEKESGVKRDRPELAKMLDFIRAGDTVIICKLDRLARSVKDLLEIVDLLERKEVALKVLNISLDTSTPTGRLMLSMLAAIGQFEREMMLERQYEGIRLAKDAGRYKGRKPTAQAKSDQVVTLAVQGVSKAKIAEKLSIGVTSVYRILQNHKQQHI